MSYAAPGVQVECGAAVEAAEARCLVRFVTSRMRRYAGNRVNQARDAPPLHR